MAISPSYLPEVSQAVALTAEELYRLNLPNKRTELVRGVLVVREPAGYWHGDVTVRLTVAIANHVNQHKLGRVFAAETGFTLFRAPDTVRAPDVAFIRTERLLTSMPRGYPELAPDLAVEVLSPDDRRGEVLDKVSDWLEAGCQAVWVVDPVRRVARVYGADGTLINLDANGTLEGREILPGFSLPLEGIFAP